jgi:large subunit ribosomal protein L32
MLPVTRTPRSRRDRRRAHHALKPLAVTVCPNCGSNKQPHAACNNCGYVRPGLIIKVASEE